MEMLNLFSCSAGVGRTGAFIVIDAMLESAEHKKVIDVFNYVQLIRTNRISMVQTEVSLVNYLRAIKISNFSKVSLFEDNGLFLLFLELI